MLKSMVRNHLYRRMSFANHWSAFDEFERLAPTEQRTFLDDQLASSLRRFASRHDALPEWKALAAATTSSEIRKHWSTLPILTKKDINERFDADRLQEELGIEGAINASGGSTGIPTRFFWDLPAFDRMSALQYYSWTKFGWKPGMPYLCLWGSPRDIGHTQSLKGRLVENAMGLTMIDGFEFSDDTVDRALAAMATRKHMALYGYSTLLSEFARRVVERGIRIPEGKVVTAWSGGEPLYPSQSERFQSAFGVPIHNSYGGREFGVIAYKLADQSSFKLFRSVTYVEIVDEHGAPTRPGESGRVVLTTLQGRGTPFVRYANGDMATYAESDIDESGLKGLSTIDGRVTSVIRLANGKAVHNIFWYHLVKDYAEIQAFHVHQDKQGSIEFAFTGAPLADGTSIKLRSLIGTMLGPDTPFSLVHVDVLPKTAQGKHLQVTTDYDPSRNDQ